MKVLSITAQKPSSTGSGVYLAELVKSFAKSGIKQAVIAGVYKEDEVTLPDETLFYPVYFKTPTLPFAICGMSDEMPYESTRYMDMTPDMVKKHKAAFVAAAKKAVDEFDPDVILCHHLYLMTAAIREAFPNKTIYGFCHNTDIRQMKKHNLCNEFIASNIRKLDKIFVLRDIHKDLVKEVYGADESIISVMGMGYNSDIFHPYENKSQSGITRIIYAGKIAEKKGVICLIKALGLLDIPPEKLEIKFAGGAGNEEEYALIKNLADSSKYNIEFLGRLDQITLSAYYGASDIYVLPSFYEGIPLTVIEALACGCKVVMSDIPGLKNWFSQNAPGADITYVTLPTMQNEDEPVARELPEFEKRLSKALFECINKNATTKADLSSLSWDSIAERCIK
ncbi:MAG: glycosyltransferase [Eubacterium sp.]|nr:glycosyltransferase [Eubacterium sp.]